MREVSKPEDLAYIVSVTLANLFFLLFYGILFVVVSPVVGLIAAIVEVYSNSRDYVNKYR
jgi:hypothetical protein